MNDHDIATIVRAAQLEPRPGELARLRERIADDAGGIATDAAGHHDDRSWTRSALLVAAVALLVAIGVGSLSWWRSDGDVPADRPQLSAPPATGATVPESASPATVPPASVASGSVLDGLDGTWLLVAVDGTPWSGPAVPIVRVEGDTLVGWDGCNGGSWSSPTAESLGAAASTLIFCETELPSIFGATALELDGAGTTLRLRGATGEFEFVPLGAGIVPTGDELAGPWEIGDVTVRWSTDPQGDLIVDVGGCGFAVDLEGAIVSPTVGPEFPDQCVGAAEAGFALALADPARELAAVLIDDVLYLTAGADALAPSEAYALVRAESTAPSDPIADGVALERGEVFGLGPDWAGATEPPSLTADDALAVIGGQLGPVAADTGWYELQLAGAAADPDCLAGAEYRVLWWGDLSVAFRRVDGAELLWTWSVGDRRASGFGDRGEPDVGDTGPATGLTTEAGIGVGSSIDELLDAYPERFFDTSQVDSDDTILYLSDRAQWSGLTNSRLGVTIRDGVVTGFAATLDVC